MFSADCSDYDFDSVCCLTDRPTVVLLFVFVIMPNSVEEQEVTIARTHIQIIRPLWLRVCRFVFATCKNRSNEKLWFLCDRNSMRFQREVFARESLTPQMGLPVRGVERARALRISVVVFPSVRQWIVRRECLLSSVCVDIVIIYVVRTYVRCVALRYDTRVVKVECQTHGLHVGKKTLSVIDE